VRPPADGAPYLVVLGTAQDGGYPQAGCRRECCEAAWIRPELRRTAASLAIVVPTAARAAESRWLIDAGPDLREQLRSLDGVSRPEPGARAPALAGILLTHGHLGHIHGLALLGREVMAAQGVPVWAMPSLAARLGEGEGWRQLVAAGHIDIMRLADGAAVNLGGGVSVVPGLVPHRSDAGETVAFTIIGPGRRVLYLPDIDGWDLPSTAGPAVSLPERVAEVDVAYVDGTFFDSREPPGRSAQDIPHPPIVDSLERLVSDGRGLAARARFTHLNHTNPVLDPGSAERARVEASGASIAAEGEIVGL